MEAMEPGSGMRGFTSTKEDDGRGGRTEVRYGGASVSNRADSGTWTSCGGPGLLAALHILDLVI
jgi:hypothetical protein